MPTTAPKPRPSLGPGWFTLARALVVVLWVTLAVHAVNVVVSFYWWRTFPSWAADPDRIDFDLLALYDPMVMLLAVVLTVLQWAVLVLFIVWLFRAHRSDRMEPGFLAHRSGWAIGAWFVPIVNVFLPFRMVEDVRRASRHNGIAPSRLATWWWLTLLAGFFAVRLTQTLVADADLEDDPLGTLNTANLGEAISSGLLVVAAVLAVLVVRETTRSVAESPHVPAAVPLAPMPPAPPAPVA